MIVKEIRNILETFSKISLSEMDKVKLMSRVETKFVFKLNELPNLLSILSKDYRVVEIEKNTMPAYESFYFDDKNLFFYSEHQRGRQNRFKVRYRRYVESNLIFFEVKHKRKGRTTKNRIRVNELKKSLGIEEKDFLKTTLIPQLNLVPSLSNSYKRITLVNKKTIERLTLDIDLNSVYGEKETSLSDIVIAELKQERITRSSPFYVAAKKLRFRSFRLSKYCTGLIQTNGMKGLKYNRFKKKLIQINKLSNYGVNVV